MPSGAPFDVEPIAAEHDVSAFDAGEADLSDWLRSFALENHRAGFTRTFVVHRDLRVVGFYALAMAAVERECAPRTIGRGGPPAIPVALLARLGVDVVEQGKGLGGALLKDAIKRAARAADEVGARALLAHAKDARARSFYEHFDFEASPTDQLHMYLRLKDAEPR